MPPFILSDAAFFFFAFWNDQHQRDAHTHHLPGSSSSLDDFRLILGCICTRYQDVEIPLLREN